MVNINMQNIALGAVGLLLATQAKKLGSLKTVGTLAGVGAVGLAAADVMGFYSIDQVKSMIPGINSMYATNVIPYQEYPY